MTDLDWAIEQTVKNKRGLSKELADVLGTSQAILLNKVNPNVDSNHLHVSEALRLMKHTGDVRILEELARDLGYEVSKSECEAKPIMDAILAAIKEQGDIASAFIGADADKVITVQEERAIRSEIVEAIGALTDIKASIEAYAKKSRGGM